jgi:hypothetical protein
MSGRRWVINRYYEDSSQVRALLSPLGVVAGLIFTVSSRIPSRPAAFWTGLAGPTSAWPSRLGRRLRLLASSLTDEQPAGRTKVLTWPGALEEACFRRGLISLAAVLAGWAPDRAVTPAGRSPPGAVVAGPAVEGHRRGRRAPNPHKCV